MKFRVYKVILNKTVALEGFSVGDSEFGFAPELLVLAFTSQSFSFSYGKIIDRPDKDWTNILPGYQDTLCLGILLFRSALPTVAWIQFGWVLCATCL